MVNRPEGVQDGVELAAAARRLGVSVDAVRKRLDRGTLQGAKVDGRWRVFLPDETPAGSTVQPEASAELVQVLKAQVADLQRRLDDAERERAELRQLVSQAQQIAGARMLPAPKETQGEEASGRPTPSWWRAFREGKRGLGASLTLTGFVAVLAGIALHLALQHQFIESEVHLGYIIGLVGLLTLLIGLVIVF